MVVLRGIEPPINGMSLTDHVMRSVNGNDILFNLIDRFSTNGKPAVTENGVRVLPIVFLETRFPEQVKKLIIQGLTRVRDSKISVSDLFTNQVDFSCLNRIGKLLTKDRNTFIKYKVVGNAFFGMSLELKVRLESNLSAWFSLNQVVHSRAVIDFQSLELVMKGLAFANMSRKTAITRCDNFLHKIKSFSVDNQVSIQPDFDQVQSANGATDKFPVNIDTILSYESF